MRRVPIAEFESDPEAIIDEVEQHGCAIALVRDGVDVLLVLPPDNHGEER